MSKASKFFTPEMFTATQWDSAAEKADFANRLLAFIEAGFPEKQFTKSLYQRLSLTFGFIAHYDRSGFWSVYFESSRGKVDFLKALLNYPCHGDPAWTYSDAERAIIRRLDHLGLYDCYCQVAAREEEAAERAKLAELQARYAAPTARLLPEHRPLSVRLRPRRQPAKPSDAETTDVSYLQNGQIHLFGIDGSADIGENS